MGTSKEGRAGEMKWALQSNNCSVKSLWATFAFLWLIHRVLGRNSLINKGFSYNGFMTFVDECMQHQLLLLQGVLKQTMVRLWWCLTA